MSTDLAVIEAALEAATPGPWVWSNSDRTTARRELDGPLTNVLATAALRWPTHEDAHLIANAPTWLAELVERVKVAEAAIERVRALLGDDSRKFIRAGEVSDAIEGRETAGDWCDSMCEVCRCCPHEWATNCHCPDPDCGCLLVCQCSLCVGGDA